MPAHSRAAFVIPSTHFRKIYFLARAHNRAIRARETLSTPNDPHMRTDRTSANIFSRKRT
jgi:hypothetical protein